MPGTPPLPRNPETPRPHRSQRPGGSRHPPDPRQLQHAQDAAHSALVRQTSQFHLHFAPTSASWLNLVERWFAALTKKQLRRGRSPKHSGSRRGHLFIGSSMPPIESPSRSSGRRRQIRSSRASPASASGPPTQDTSALAAHTICVPLGTLTQVMARLRPRNHEIRWEMACGGAAFPLGRTLRSPRVRKTRLSGKRRPGGQRWCLGPRSPNGPCRVRLGWE